MLGRSQATPLTAWLRVPLPWFSSSTQALFPDESHSSIRRTFTPLHAPHSQRIFCGYCGTHISYWTEHPPAEAEYLSITLGSLSNNDLHALQELDLLPDDVVNQDIQPNTILPSSSPAVQPPVPSQPAEQMQQRGQTVMHSHRTGRLGAISWFEELLEGSRLGRSHNTRRGHGLSADGSTKVEWEVSEYFDNGTEEPESSQATPTGSKRKIDDVGAGDDTKMHG